MKTLAYAVLLLALTSYNAAASSIGDFENWFGVLDPTGTVGFDADAMGPVATLSADNTFIPAGSDISISSINANTVAEATEGFFFDPGSDFTVAIDFSFATTNLDGVIGIGFGIGEDARGVNSAGAGFARALVTTGQGIVSLEGTAAAATNNDNALVGDLAEIGASGSYIVAYDAATGDVTAGVAGAGVDTPTSTFTFLGDDDLDAWNGDPLLVSFFLRSETETVNTSLGQVMLLGYNGESATAVFSNFRVLAGTPTVIPEPSAAALLIAASLVATARRRRRGAAR